MKLFKRSSDLALSKLKISRLITQEFAPKNMVWQEEERLRFLCKRE